MVITTVINNFNYGRFLTDAIESALQQDYPDVEVIVVDDGSTDQSRRIIEGYEARVTAIYKDNGGQGSAFNAGFAASKGDVICFLDADDLFLPNKLSKIGRAYARNPGATLVYHKLQAVDPAKRPLGRPWPNAVVCGDIRSSVEESGGWWPWPTTSGLCASRAFLSKILPMPCEPYRLCADAYVAGLAPFCGPVIGIPESLGLYRIHGNNSHNVRHGDGGKEAERRLRRLTVEFDELRATLRDRLGMDSPMRLEDNLSYQRLRLAIDGSHSKLRVLKTVCRTATLPTPSKLREAVKVILNRV